MLRAIDNLECDAECNRRNFAPIAYADARNRQQRKVVMTRDGFAFLVMGFTGKRAAEFKQGYIEQFNQMEAALNFASTILCPLTNRHNFVATSYVSDKTHDAVLQAIDNLECDAEFGRLNFAPTSCALP